MKRRSGLTLVEVLIAMALVLVVTAAALAFVARGRAAQRSGESLARLEEALDAAFVLLVDEIRLAGYLGLAPAGTLAAGATPFGSAESPGLAVAGGCGASLAHDPAPVAAADGAWQLGPGQPIPCRPSPHGRQQPGTDLLVLRHASALATPPSAGRLQLETTLRTARLVADGGSQFGADARRHDLEAGLYYVSADATGRDGWPALRRKRLVGGTRPWFQDEELVAGISDLQVELGMDDDVDLAVDRWQAPGMPAPVGGLRAVRLTLEARSGVAEAGQPPGGRRKRVTRIVGLRNAGGGE